MPDARCIEHQMGAKCSTRVIARRISVLAERQHGVVARRQLLDLGLGRRAISGRVERGQLHLVHRGVYAVGHRRITLKGRWMAAVLACGEGAVLSHRSAGQLWGILPKTSAWPEVTRPKGSRPRPGISAHRGRIPEDEIRVIDGIPVTCLSRTMLDLATRSSRGQIERMMNEAQVQGLTDAMPISSLLTRYPRRSGSAVLRRVLREQANARGITRKELERRFKEILDATDLPRPQRNAHIAARGRFFEVDCLWRSQRLIVELDGRAVHGTDMAFERDREKDRLLIAEGWRVTRITWRHLDREAETVVADLRSALRVSSRSRTL